jgi:hypothetical protein
MELHLKKKIILLANSLIVAGGIILLLVALTMIQNVTWKELWLAIGTSLVAAGIINSLDRFIIEKPSRTRVEMVEAQRKNLPRQHHEQKYQVSKFDLLAVSMTDCLKEIVENNRMIEQILFDNYRLQLIFVDPRATFIKQRAPEDKLSEDDLVERQKQSVSYVIEFYKKLNNSYETVRENGRLNENKVGNVEIKLIKVCPYLTIERFDNEIYWGIYTSAAEGKNCAIFSVKDELNHDLFDQLKKHFYALLNRAPGNYLMTMATGGPPKLYSKVAKSIVGEAELNRILE